MKIIRFDSVGGASGDMILGALIALGADRDTIVRGLESLLPGHFTLSVEETSSHGIAGVRARVALRRRSIIITAAESTGRSMDTTTMITMRSGKSGR